MNILILTAFPPNNKTAGQNYTKLLIDDLINKGFDISIINFDFPTHEIEINRKVRILKSFSCSLINCLKKINFHPFFTKRFSKKIMIYINSIANDFDMIYFDFSQVHIYSLFINHPIKVLMCHDIIFQKYSRKNSLLLKWIKFTEKKILQSANKIITFSEKDSIILRKEYKLTSIPVNFYLKETSFSNIKKIEIKKTVFAFYGAWNRVENSESLIWFLSNVLPLLNKTVKFWIIGSGITDELRTTIAKHSDCEIIGFVEDPLMEIFKVQGIITPLKKGAGVKVKVIDALTTGTPVIGTEVAFEGIQDNIKKPLFFKCNKPEEYAKIINSWEPIASNFKEQARNEFYNRYNKNHFPELLILGNK